MKTFVVCLSRDLPPSHLRDSDHVYFTYDSLSVYMGSSEALQENFAIVNEMPESPVSDMIYILTNGSVHQYLDYTDTTIAETDDPEMIANILKAGTTFFINGESKYIDKQSRVLVLPFNDGTYELAVNADKEQMYNNDTVIKYSEEAGRFLIYGEKVTPSSGDPDTLEPYEEYSEQGLRGGNTSSVHTEVNGGRIDASVILSPEFDNILKVTGDGLYVRSSGTVTMDDFEQLLTDYRDFKQYAEDILDNLEVQIDYVNSIISEESVDAEIHNQLQVEFPTIETALDNLDQMRTTLDNLESELMYYISSTMVARINDIDDGIQHSSSWDDLSAGVSDYTHEVNYYDKYNTWTQELPKELLQTVLLSAISAYIAGLNS